MLWQRRNRRWIAVGLGVLAWLAIGLTLPFLVSFYAEGTGSPNAVVAAPRDSYTIDRRIRVGGAAGPAIDVLRGTVLLVDRPGKRAAPTAANGPGIAANSHLVLDVATISIDGLRGALNTGGIDRSRAPVASEVRDDDAPLLQALAAARFEALELRRCRVLIRLAGGKLEPLGDVNAKLVFKRKGVVGIAGSARVRGRRVAFNSTLGSATGGTLGSKPGGIGGEVATEKARSGLGDLGLPFMIEIKGGLADARFDGRLRVGKELELRGTGDVVVPKGRRLARWFGAYWNSSVGLQQIRAKGDVTIAKSTLAFGKATFQMDGNVANGALALDFAKARPQLSGTLALQRLDASRYFSADANGIANARDGLSWASLSAGVLTVPLGLHLDADVRISADQVRAGKLELGPTAAAIALKDGQLLADIAEMNFGGGVGGGQIAADFTGIVPRIVVRGKLQNVDLGIVTKLMVGATALQARGMVVADLTSQGGTLPDLLGKISGKIAMSGLGSGMLGFDLLKLVAGPARGVLDEKVAETRGWGGAAKGTTAFDRLDLRLVARDGVLLTETAELQLAGKTWSATGVLSLPTSRLDVRIVQSSKKQVAQVGAGAWASRSEVELTGPWANPVIKRIVSSDGAVGAID